MGYSGTTVVITVLLQLWSTHAQTDCVRRQAKYGIMCVCNATYCDNPGPILIPPTGQFLQYLTTEAGDRFNQSTGTFSDETYPHNCWKKHGPLCIMKYMKSSINTLVNELRLRFSWLHPHEVVDLRVTVDRSKSYQKMYGFGGAMTDAAALNIRNLSSGAQDKLLRSYFASEGINYNLVRVPMGGSDFSIRNYSYDDAYVHDITLEHFNLTVEDFDFKIPLLKRAQELSNNRLLLFTSPWGSPAWMKTNNATNGLGVLKKEYYEVWAQYFVKFLEAYSNNGLEFWALTTGNEPESACHTPKYRWNCIHWLVSDMRDWIGNNLGPALKNSFPNIKVLTLDDQRIFVLPWADVVLGDKKSKQYVDGFALHWYLDTFIPPGILDVTHDSWPDYFLLYTEASNGFEPFHKRYIKPGSWKRGVKYFYSLIQTSNHWVSGWTDWNMALNTEGGPSWIGNIDDTPIHVNSTADEFYKQPMFYAMGHFSKFVPEGSTRIGLDVKGIHGTAFVRPDNATVVVLLNKYSATCNVTIVDGDRGEAVITLPAQSFCTIIWS